MSIVLAQIKKDIQSQRNALIAWGICVGITLIPVILDHFHSAEVPPGKMVDLISLGGMVLTSGFIELVGFSVIALIALYLLIPFLVICIVHEDCLVGTTAFWMTRPILRTKLLVAKAIFIAVLFLPLVLINELNAHDSRGHLWVSAFALISAIAALTSITSGMRQFLGYGMALIIGKAIFAGILATMWIRYFGPSYSIHEGLAEQNFGALKTPQLNATDYVHLIYFIGFSIVIIHQYLTLERKRSLAFLIVVVAVGCLTKLVLAYHGIL